MENIPLVEESFLDINVFARKSFVYEHGVTGLGGPPIFFLYFYSNFITDLHLCFLLYIWCHPRCLAVIECSPYSIAPQQLGVFANVLTVVFGARVADLHSDISYFLCYSPE